MADKRIVDLPLIFSGDITSTDVLPIVNIESDITNKIEIDELKSYINSGLTDYFTTGGSYNSITKYLEFSGNNAITTFQVDVSVLANDQNTYTTGITFNQNTDTLTLNLNDGSSLNTVINRYNRWYVPSGQTYIVENDFQSFIYGDLIVEGIVDLQESGELVVLNGNIILSGGTIIGSGTTSIISLPEYNTFVTNGTFDPGTKQITFTGNFGFSPFTVDLSSLSTDNFYTTGGTYNPITESIDFSGNSSATTFTVDVSQLLDDTNTYTTGATLNGTVVEFNRNDISNAYSVDLSPLDVNLYNSDGTLTGGRTVNMNGNGLNFLNGNSVFSGTTTDVVKIYGSGTTSPIFSIQGSSGELFSVTDSLIGSLFSVNDISGLPVLEAFSDNTILIGSFLAPSLNTTVKTTLSSGDNVIYSIPTSAYTGAFFDYTVVSSTGARAGNVMSIWSGSTTQYTDVSTNDIGVTSGVTFSVTISGSSAVFSSSATTADWTLKTIVRSI